MKFGLHLDLNLHLDVNLHLDLDVYLDIENKPESKSFFEVTFWYKM